MAHLAPKPESDDEPYTKELSLTNDVAGSDIVKQHKETADANYDQYRTRTNANVGEFSKTVKRKDQMEEMVQEAEVQGDAPESSSSSRLILVGGGMMLVAGLAAFAVRRQRGYSQINELSI